MYKRGNIFHFIALKMADKMPVDIFWKLCRLINQFLYIVLTKIALTEIIELHYIGYGSYFGNSDQGDFFGSKFCYNIEVSFFIDRHEANVKCKM